VQVFAASFCVLVPLRLHFIVQHQDMHILNSGAAAGCQGLTSMVLWQLPSGC
jgi:hypothetical protein